MTALLSGMLIAGDLVVALFFLRFWRQSRDRLFVMFSVAFFVLAIQRIALSLSHGALEDQTAYYALRLMAYSIIAYAIIDKNRR